MSNIGAVNQAPGAVQSLARGNDADRAKAQSLVQRPGSCRDRRRVRHRSLLPVELILQVGSGAGFAMVFALLLAAILWLLRSFL